MQKKPTVTTGVLPVSHASSVYTHRFGLLMLCQLGCVLSMPYYANDIRVTCMYPTCCRLTGSSFCSEVIDAVEHHLSPHKAVVTPHLLCKLFPLVFVKVKLCDSVCAGGCGVSGMLACYYEKIMWTAM
ncbi:hypothetical protein CHARACLAT_008947 [Characodon lateralis]|uniref:Uncharacterized protein n=1 Tax=Characodon lateralis TaxID=208331 RepID=A0ABU7F1D9_9TELE|nr:hypothetical protein [Characodon lateralis]